MRLLLLPTLLAATGCVFAQSVPALKEPQSTPASLSSAVPLPLSPQATQSLALVNKWVNGTTRPVTKGDGSVTWFFGASLPTVVCAPLRTCDIALEPGERITKKGVHTGDAVRWDISPALSGESDNQVTHLIVKPSDVGLSTTLVIATNRRTYHIALASRDKDWTPAVNFDYPEQVQQEWDSYYAQEAETKAQKTLGNGLNIDTLDFNYSISGNAPFKPLRVYNNSVKTIIEMPASVNTRELPTLMAVNAGEKEVVNYRYRDNKFIVDQLAREIVLISGVGSHQQSLLITWQGDHE